MSILACGKTIWHTVKDSIEVSMAPLTMETGSMTSSMASVRKFGLMEAAMKVIMLLVKSTDMESSTGPTAPPTKVTLAKTRYADKVTTNGPTGTSIGAPLKRGKCMVMDSTRSPMDADMSVSSRMIKRTEKG